MSAVRESYDPGGSAFARSRCASPSTHLQTGGPETGNKASPSYSSLHRVIDGLTCGRGIAVRNFIAQADRICWA